MQPTSTAPRRVHSAFRIGDEAGLAPTGAPGVCQYGYPILELKKAEEAAKLSNGRATMKRILPVVPFLLVVLAGCANMTKQQQQMLSGGAMGAGTGATIGLIAGPPGALVGAVVGGAAGTVTGANWEGIKKATK